MARDVVNPEVVEDDDSEVKDDKSEAEKGFSDAFKTAASHKEPDKQDKAKEEKPDGEQGDGESASSQEDKDAEEDKEAEKKAADGKDKKGASEKAGDEAGDKAGEETPQERIERVAQDLKTKREKESKAKEAEKEEEEDERPRKAKARKEKAEEEQEEEPEPKRAKRSAEPEDVLADIDLTDEEKEYISDYGESVSLVKKLATKIAGRVVRESIEDSFSKVIPKVQETLDKQNETIAVLRSEVYLTERVPDWKHIVYEKDGRTENAEFWGWVKEQPKLWQMLAASDNPEDNAEILLFYKSTKEQAKQEEVKKKQAKEREKFEAIRGNSPESGRAVKDTKAKDFSGAFSEFASH